MVRHLEEVIGDIGSTTFSVAQILNLFNTYELSSGLIECAKDRVLSRTLSSGNLARNSTYSNDGDDPAIDTERNERSYFSL